MWESKAMNGVFRNEAQEKYINSYVDQRLNTPECRQRHYPQHPLSINIASGDGPNIAGERWSDRAAQAHVSSVSSLFNCDLSDAKCRYFYPANFFEERCGLGKEFRHFLYTMEAMRKNESLFRNGPYIGFRQITMDNYCVLVDGNIADKNITARQKQGWDASPEATLTDLGEHFELSPLQPQSRAIGSDNYDDDYYYADPNPDDLKGNEDSPLRRCLTERLSVIHVHKAGGSSLFRIFQNMGGKGLQNLQYIPHHWFFPDGDGDRKGVFDGVDKAEKYFQAKESMLQATKYPPSIMGPEQHIVFAIVRDPLERFISSVGQAMGATGSGWNGIGPVLREECITNTLYTTRDEESIASPALTPKGKVLKCMAQYVTNNGFWVELHFVPQVIDVAFATMFLDVPVAVFPFVELPTILRYFGSDPKMLHEKDNRKKSNRPHPILVNMTVSDYDDETIRLVCKLYEMDVRMQRSLGMEVPRCDPYIPD